MSSRLSIRSATSTTAVAESSKSQRDEVSKIQQDINIISQKIAELRGDPTPPIDSESSSLSGASPFVVGLRSLAESERKFKDVKDLRLNAMEKLLEKVGEYDRLLLKETTPVVDPSAVPQRRKSFGQDLFCLPTHLHLTARLLDLHASSKRVTVIKTVETGGISTASSSGLPPNPADKKVIDGLKATVTKQAKQIEDAEAKRAHTEEEIQYLKKNNEELKAHIATMQSKPAPPAAAAAAAVAAVVTPAAPPIVAVQAAPLDHSAEVVALRARVQEQERHTDTLQQRLEAEVGSYQAMVAVALGKASRLNNHVELDGRGDDCVNLPNDGRNAYNLLEKAIAGRIDGLKAELSLIMSIKDLLEGELSTANLQKDILQRDLVTVQEQHETLKAAYDALSYETARQLSQAQHTAGEAEAQARLLQSANDANKALHTELEEAQQSLKSLEKWPVALAALEEKLAAAVQDKTRAEAIAAGAREEVGHYKKLTETLKQKLRDLSDHSGDNKEFLDSFEEVMKEEMMTMKAAFESKLRLAREEADATSKRHQQEIVRIQATSPYAALQRVAGGSGSGSSTSLGVGARVGLGAGVAAGGTTGSLLSSSRGTLPPSK